MEDETDLTTLRGDQDQFGGLVDALFSDDFGNATWGTLKHSTFAEFIDTFSQSQPLLKARLTSWVRHYGLESEFLQPKAGWKTPTKEAFRELGVSDSLTPNQAIGAVVSYLAEAKNKYRYTTQDETTIGRRIQSDNAAQGGGFTAENKDYTVSHEFGSVLFIDPNSASYGEDLEVNEPFRRALSMICPPSLTVHFTGHAANLIDAEGREQRVDLSIHDGTNQEWATLITVLEGKIDLGKPNLDSGIGQCMRRAHAIMDAQPWRKVVVVALFCLKQIVFLRVERTEPFGHLSPTHTEKMKCFLFDKGSATAGEGFRSLAAMISNPSLFGYLPFPVKILDDSLAALELHSVVPIAGRNSKKSIFFGLNGESEVVLKVYAEKERALRELKMIQTLEDIETVIDAAASNILPVNVQVAGEPENIEAFSLMLQPHCRALVPSIATPALFRSYALTLERASKSGLCNNDISPDNLLVRKDDSRVGIVTDWETATAPGTMISRKCGKLLFIPYIEENQDERMSSLLGDLESLFYVAVACAENGAPWAQRAKRQDHRLSDVHEQRKRDTGLYGRKSRSFPGDWEPYLAGIARALERADVNATMGAFSQVDNE